MPLSHVDLERRIDRTDAKTVSLVFEIVPRGSRRESNHRAHHQQQRAQSRRRLKGRFGSGRGECDAGVPIRRRVSVTPCPLSTIAVINKKEMRTMSVVTRTQ